MHTVPVAYFLALLTLPGSHAEEDIIRTRLFSGIYLRPDNYILPYQSSIPLTYQIPIQFKIPQPRKSEPLKSCPTSVDNSTYCSIHNKLTDIQSHILDQLKLEATYFPPQSNRSKRSLAFISDFFTWCCAFANEHEIKDLVDNQQDLTSHINDITDSVTSDHQDLLITSNQMTRFSQDISSANNKMHQNLIDIQREIVDLRTNTGLNYQNQMYSSLLQIWVFTYYNFYYDNLRQINQICGRNNIPPQLIPRNTLLQDILKLQGRAQRKNLTTAIPNEKLFLYYSMPITTCSINPDYIFIKIKVPLKSISTSLKPYRTIKTPLTWDDKVCYITQASLIVIKSDQQTIVMEEDENCDKTTLPLCHIPRSALADNQLARCFNGIINGGNVGQLREHCPFTCYPRAEEPIVSPILPNKFLISNVNRNLTIHCRNKTSRLIPPTKTSGALQFDIPCSCQLIDHSSILIDYVQPCDSQDIEDPKLKHLLPIAWTTLEDLQMDPLENHISHEFDNITKLINDNWTVSAPTYFVHNSKKQLSLEHVSLKHKLTDILNDTNLLTYILLVWISILTVILLIAIYFIHIQYIELKCLRPSLAPRDYPMLDVDHRH